MPVSKEGKEALKAAGLWQKFLTRRQELKDSGMSARDANLQAEEELLSDTPTPTVADTSNKCDDMDEMAILMDEISKASEETPAPIEDLPLSYDIISQLPQCSNPVDMIQWVAANMKGETDLDSCPGRDAYALLADCHASPGLRQDFWKSMYTRIIPSRAQLTGDDGEVLDDGEHIAVVLRKIQKASGKKEEEE